MDFTREPQTKFQSPWAGVRTLNAGDAHISLGTHNENSLNKYPVFADENTVSEIDSFIEKLPVQELKNTVAPENHPAIVKPGDYQPAYCEMMIEYFDKPKAKRIVDYYTWKSGAVSEKERFVPNTPPHFSEFARTIGVTAKKLEYWASQHPEFALAYDQCQEILEEFLIDNGLTGAYGAIAMKFVAVNRSSMKDKQVTENIAVDINKVLDQIADGKVRPGGLLEMPQGGLNY